MNAGAGSRVRKSKRRNRGRRILVRKAALLVLVTAAYVIIGTRYINTFLPNTKIGGIGASGMTVDEVKSEIDAGIGGYELVLEERYGKEERIYGRDIGLCMVYGEALDTILEEQNFLTWGLRWVKGREYRLERMVTFDKAKLEAVSDMLGCLDPGQITEPADSYLSYLDGVGLRIVPEIQGNLPVRERLLEEIENAVLSLSGRISLETLDIYKTPDILKEDPGLTARKDAWETYTDVVVAYRFGSKTEVLDGNTIFQWLEDDGEGNTVISQTKIDEYVRELAKKYNTAYCAKKFKTSYGTEITITKGSYGWMIDKQAEASALSEMIRSGESGEREPVYAQRAASHDGPDYGNTYVELNLTDQHMYFYKNGKLFLESKFVSGDEARGWSTPVGAYEITYKQRNAVLKGKGYFTPVTYWMPFHGNIGMHDGYWRTSFGGTIYKKNGSHGCVNLPPTVARTLFENIEAGIPVLCYQLEGTQSGKTTYEASEKPASRSKKSSSVKQPEPTVESVRPSESATQESMAESDPVPSEAPVAESLTPVIRETEETVPVTAAPGP